MAETVVSRVCLDMLRSTSSRKEQVLNSQVERSATRSERPRDPEQEALLADSIGAALLIVPDRLHPAERLSQK
jgi:RNA polymerase sigma-70 factor (ECF subfamily)